MIGRARSAGSLVVLTVLVAAGCRGSAPAAERGPVPITVTNNLGLGPATIFVVWGTGPGRVIGTVNHPETTTLSYDGPSVAQRLRLRGVVTGARDIVSESFVIPTNARVEWDLRTNRVTTPTIRAADPPGRVAP